MWTFFKWLLSLLPTVLGWFGIGSKSEAELDRAAGERLGKAETNAEINRTELDTAQQAVAASRAAGDADDAGELRKPHAGDKPWDPDAIG